MIRRRRDRQVSSSASGGWSRPWKRFQVRTRRSIAANYRSRHGGSPLAPASIRPLVRARRSNLPRFHGSRTAPTSPTSLPATSSPSASSALLDRADELKADRPGGRLRFAGGQIGRPDLRAALDPDPHLVRGRSRRARRHADRPSQRRAADQPRRIDRRHRPGHVPLRPCDRDPQPFPRARRRARRRRRRAGDQRAHPAAPSRARRSPTCRRCGSASAGSRGCGVAFVGDGNNVARSLALLGRAAGVEVVVSSPPGFELEDAPGAELIADPREAVAGADAVYTDVWISMGETDAEAKRDGAVPYRVDDELLDLAADRVVVLHCLPGPPRRGDQRRGPLRAALSGLRPGREPPSRPEGPPGDAARLRTLPGPPRISRPAAPSSNGQDSRFSFWQRGFDSPRGYFPGTACIQRSTSGRSPCRRSGSCSGSASSSPG